MALEAARQVIRSCAAEDKSMIKAVKTLLLQVVSTQPSPPQVESDLKARPVLDTHSQHGSRDASPARVRSPDKPRPSSPEHNSMFRFQRHFEAPNNPDLPEPGQLPHVQPVLQAAPAATSNQQPQQASATTAAAVAASPMQAQGANDAQGSEHAVRQNEVQRRPESLFRRSHSPDFYDAKFKRYILRCSL